MSERKKKCVAGKRIHCWHVEGSVTNGLAVEGYDRERCCNCGHTQRRHWRYERDPQHGPHVDLTVRVEVADPS